MTGGVGWVPDMKDVPTDFPGHDLVSAGLADLAAGRESESAMLVAMASRRLRAAGYEVPSSGVERPSHRLYELLLEKYDDDAHSRYNALVRQLVSFAQAAEREYSRALK
jgi:hypothetical protein